MTNLPALTLPVLAVIVLADLIVLVGFFLMAGPAFARGEDLYGRPLPAPSARSRLLLGVVAFLVAGFLASQIAILAEYRDYLLDSGSVAVERIVDMRVTEDTEGRVVARWISTENHRFGVGAPIYDAFAEGDLVRFRYRAADDTLFAIEPAPTVSPAP